MRCRYVLFTLFNFCFIPSKCNKHGLSVHINTGSFLPVTLEQLARENGVLRSDGSPCIKPKIPESDASNALLRLVRRAAQGEEESQCVIHPFGREISTASFAMYTFSIAVLVQALVLVSFSSVADHGKILYSRWGSQVLMCAF